MYRAGRSNEPSFLQRMADTIGLGGSGEEAPAGDLDDWLARTLKDALGFKVERDEDGDIPIPYGSAVVFIGRHDPESPFLEIFAPLLADFTLTTEVYEAVNSINAQVPLAKAVVVEDDKQIVLSASLPVVGTVSPDELMLVIEIVADAAEHFDSLLQKRFGGTTMLDDDGDEFDV